MDETINFLKSLTNEQLEKLIDVCNTETDLGTLNYLANKEQERRYNHENKH